MHNITRNLEAEFNEVELMPKTKEATIMAAAAYIAANASNGNEHMRHLRNLALEGVTVLQGTPGSGHDATPRIDARPVEQARHPAAVPVVAPRTQAVEPINGELRHGLAQNRVDQGRARCEARRFEEERDMFSGAHDGLCGCRCSGYWGIPVHLLLGPVISPSSAQRRINEPSYKGDPHEEAPREENDDRNR
jgi:hypothetical protein